MWDWGLVFLLRGAWGAGLGEFWFFWVIFIEVGGVFLCKVKGYWYFVSVRIGVNWGFFTGFSWLKMGGGHF
jgi:hypothetical protein